MQIILMQSKWGPTDKPVLTFKLQDAQNRSGEINFESFESLNEPTFFFNSRRVTENLGLF